MYECEQPAIESVYNNNQLRQNCSSYRTSLCSLDANV